jgi:flagellar basal-body rod modification protein FlgD
MSVTSTAATNSATTGAGAYGTTQTQPIQLPQQMLGQADFLKLLVAQLSAQDPMNPVSNTDFAAQMAQFSTLQTTQTMQTNMAAVQAGLGVLVADSLLGATVSLQTSDGQTVTGVVNTVQYQSGSPTITVNGQVYNLSQVTSVSQTQTNSPSQ